jgi:hypothetical protein
VTDKEVQMTEGIFALVGVVLGGLIAAVAQWLVTSYQIKNQFRLAVVERRLEAHQAAYELCYKLRCAMHKSGSEKQDLMKEYEQWWLRNCIYLGSQSRQAVDGLFQRWSLYDPADRDTDKMNDLARFFDTAVQTLTREVCLPAVAEDAKFIS